MTKQELKTPMRRRRFAKLSVMAFVIGLIAMGAFVLPTFGQDQGHVPGGVQGNISDSEFWRQIRQGQEGHVSNPSGQWERLIAAEYLACQKDDYCTEKVVGFALPIHETMPTIAEKQGVGVGMPILLILGVFFTTLLTWIAWVLYKLGEDKSNDDTFSSYRFKRMSSNRRNFLKGATATSVAIIAGGVAHPAAARDNLEMPPEAVGLLFDSTLCVGCKACVTACKIANNKPLNVPRDKPYLDETKTLSPDALNIIKLYRDGKAEKKDREIDGFAFMKRSCMHCVDPACVSACPVNAMEKQPLSGVVTYNKDACIGCRYCVYACPYNIPRFDYGSATPEIHKCQLCNHLWKDGGFSACADVCPTGATLFGPVIKLQAEVERRKKLIPGEITNFPRRSTETGERSRKQPAADYIDHVYGEKEQGGTQMLMMSGVPFDKLGMPDLPERSYASISETLQHTLYDGLIAPIVVLGGLLFLTHRNAEKDHQDKGGEDA